MPGAAYGSSHESAGEKRTDRSARAEIAVEVLVMAADAGRAELRPVPVIVTAP